MSFINKLDCMTTLPSDISISDRIQTVLQQIDQYLFNLDLACLDPACLPTRMKLDHYAT